MRSASPLAAQHCCEMFRQLATLLKRGLTFVHSLQMLAEQHRFKPWQALLQSIADELSEGSPFSESLKKWPAVFSPLHVSMVKKPVSSQGNWRSAAASSRSSKKRSSSSERR